MQVKIIKQVSEERSNREKLKLERPSRPHFHHRCNNADGRHREMKCALRVKQSATV